MLRAGGALAAVAGVPWVAASLVMPPSSAWLPLVVIVNVAGVVISGSLGSRAGFWGWLAVRGFIGALLALTAGQAFGGGIGPPLSAVGLAALWLTGLFAAIGALSSRAAGRLGPGLAVAGWVFIYLTFILPISTWFAIPYGIGWGLTGLHLARGPDPARL